MFLKAIPYALAGLTILLGLFQLIKEWNEYSHKWLRRCVLFVLMTVAILTFVSLHLDSKAKERDRITSEGDIRELKTKVQAANDAQANNTALFLKSFSAMSNEVSNLKAEVKTEALQKKLASVQADLEKTEKALAPSPKAELFFTFMPFNNPPTNSLSPANPVTDIDLPMQPDGSVHVEGGALNVTSVDAADVDLNIQICDQCKYAKEPANTVKLAGFPDTIRLIKIAHVQGMQVATPIILDITVPLGTKQFPVGFSYRCSTCVVTTKASMGMVHILGIQTF
jgi:hypothetical protein